MRQVRLVQEQIHPGPIGGTSWFVRSILWEDREENFSQPRIVVIHKALSSHGKTPPQIWRGTIIVVYVKLEDLRTAYNELVSDHSLQQTFTTVSGMTSRELSDRRKGP
jgi:hypothetical protein